ncbi:HAD family phosphatase [Streptomyces sp. NPDC021562]|uniref:HAD family hydrolase n=1 Tax=Streptomyces sp. NPDC021562 TaxID=3155121 RepID=UPI003405CC24
MTPTPRATVFDLDDTLIDTADGWPRACAAFTARHGHRWGPADTAALHGNGGWASYVAALCGAPVGAAEVVEDCTEAMVRDHGAGLVRALPGAMELVREAERYGPIAVATASPRRFVRAVLDGLGLTSRLSAVVCGEDAARGKPAPDAYLHAAARLGLLPADCLAVEDSPNGIRAAAAAGLRVLAIPRDRMRLPVTLTHLITDQADTASAALPVLRRLLSARPEPTGQRTPAAGSPRPHAG